MPPPYGFEAAGAGREGCWAKGGIGTPDGVVLGGAPLGRGMLGLETPGAIPPMAAGTAPGGIPLGDEAMGGGMDEPPAAGTGFLPRRALRSILGFCSDIGFLRAGRWPIQVGVAAAQ